ncbi:unnamed protein product [Rotaria sp. Silwood1]|nr:unnamed protein product [Rotaria sp. Silwood1]
MTTSKLIRQFHGKDIPIEMLSNMDSLYYRLNNYEESPHQVESAYTNSILITMRYNLARVCEASFELNKTETLYKEILHHEHDSQDVVAHLTLVVLKARDLIPPMTTPERFVSFLNLYCEITIGSLTLKTPFMKRTNNPKWNTSIQFSLHNITEDIIYINIFHNNFFSTKWFVGNVFLSFPSKHPSLLFLFLQNIGYTSASSKVILNKIKVLRKRCQQLEYLLLDEHDFHSNKTLNFDQV